MIEGINTEEIAGAAVKGIAIGIILVIAIIVLIVRNQED